MGFTYEHEINSFHDMFRQEHNGKFVGNFEPVDLLKYNCWLSFVSHVLHENNTSRYPEM